jgi:hypothetical protein
MAHPPPPRALIWAQINHQLVGLKIRQASAEFGRKNRGNLPKPKGNHLESTKDWTEKVFAIYGEVWEKQGKARTPDFIRVVFDRAIVPAIAARVGSAKFEIELHAKRTGRPAMLGPSLQKLVLDADRLKSEWRTRIEIEAQELQLKGATAGRQSSQAVAEKAMADLLPDLAKLPAGLLSTGDPVDGNPFPTDDPRHNVWADATLRAEEELCRFNSDSLKGWRFDPKGPAPWMVNFASGKFDIWAKRNIQVVWSDGAVRDYDRWLFDYAESWLQVMSKGRLTVTDTETLLVQLRARLIERREHWRAEARRYRRQQEAQAKLEAKGGDAATASLQASVQQSGNSVADESVLGRTPEEELESFLAGLPVWQRKALECDFTSMTEEEQRESLRPAATEGEYLEILKAQHRYVELVHRVPSKLRTLKGRIKRNIGAVVAPGRPGRPRKDALAAEALSLKAKGKSWAAVALSLKKNKEAIRKLVKSRTRPPEKNRR